MSAGIVSAQSDAPWGDIPTGDFGEVIKTDEVLVSPGFGPSSGFSGYIYAYTFQGDILEAKAEILITREEQDASGRLVATEDVTRIGVCRGGASESVIFPVLNCIDPITMRWSTGTSPAPGIYSIRAFMNGYYHPLHEKKIEKHSGSGVVDVGGLILYRQNIGFEFLSIERIENGVVNTRWRVTNNTEWEQRVHFHYTLLGPSYTHENAIIAEFPHWGLKPIPPGESFDVSLWFSVDPYTGYNKGDSLCPRMVMYAPNYPSFGYVDQTECISADMPKPPTGGGKG